MPDNITALKKWTAPIVITLFLIAVITDCVYSFISDNAFQFYRSAPHYLFYVLLCAIGIGLIAMLAERLIDNSGRVKRILKTIEIIFITIMSIALIVLCCYSF
jgi:uncharacterized membrane protein